MTAIMSDKAGLTKLIWADVRDRVMKVEPIFASHVDKISPDDSFSIYLAYYPYGAVEADTQSSIFPSNDGGFYRLTDANAPKDIIKNLGYSAGSAPLGMVIEKQLELFIDMKNEGMTIPWRIYKPGMIFPFSYILKGKSSRNYAPNGILSSTAGVRSAFMLPNVGCSISHSHLKRDIGIKSESPKSLYDHWTIFKEIASVTSDWRCGIIYFAEKWVDKLNNDVAWSELKQYLHELALNNYAYARNRIYYDIAFSVIQKKRNLKPNPYLTDTAKHLFSTACGVAPGFEPALDEEALPLNDIQKAYVESYNLKKYYPTIIKPCHFEYETDTLPVYYSFKNPTTHIFSPKSRETTNTLYELRELENIMRVFIEEISNPDSPCGDTIISDVAKKVEFDFYHSENDRYNIIKSTNEILKIDNRFELVQKELSKQGARFSSDAAFLRGSVSIRTK